MPIGVGGADEILRVFIGIDTDAGVQLRAVNGQIEQFTQRANKRIGLAGKTFQALGSQIGGVTSRITAFAKRYTAIAASIAGAAAIFRSVSDAQKFGMAIAEIDTIFEGSAAALGEVERRVLGLAEALGASETIAAKGFYQIISSDITDAAEAMLVLTEGTELATVGLADVKDTVNVLTSVIKAYQRPVEDAADITNVLFRAVIKGKTTIPELATSLGQVLPIAATLGVELEEVAAAIATLTQGGIETNTAVIQLRQVFNQLLKPSAEAKEVMAQFGLNVSVADIKSRGFVETLREVEEKVGGNAAAMAKLFGNIRGLIPTLALTGKQAEQFRQNLAFISDDADKVGESLSAFLENPFKKLQRFVNILRLQLREAGDIFIKGVAAELDARGGIEAVAENMKAAFGAIKGFAEAAAKTVGRLIGTVVGFVNSFGGVEEAAAVFRAFGRVVGDAFGLVVQWIVTFQSVVLQFMVQMPELLRAAVRELKKGINEILPSTVLDIEVGIDTEAVRDKIARLRLAVRSDMAFISKNVFREAIEQAGRAGDDAGREMYQKLAQRVARELSTGEMSFDDFVGKFGEDLLSRGIDWDEGLLAAARRLTEYEAQFGKLREDLAVAPPTLNEISESMQGTIDRVNELADAGLSLRDSIVGWNQALEDARAPKRGGAPTMLDLFGAPMPDDILFTVPPPEISDEDRKNFFATLGELQILAESFGVKVPVEFALGRDDVTKEAIQDFVRFIEESAGLPTRLVPQNTALDEYVASADSVREAAARTLELTERQISALSDLNGTEVARAELIRKSAGQRKRELEDFLAIKNASEEFRAVMLDLFNLGVEQDVADIFAFKDFGTEFEKAARGLTDTLDKQRVALEKNNAAIRERAADLRAVGLITEEEAKRIEDVLGRTVEQFNEKVSKAIFSQEAFQRTDNVALMFEDIERAAKEAAIAATGITKATSEEDILKLRAAYDAAFDAMTRKSELFTRSFGAAWRDMVDDMLDMTRIGAETAAGILDGLRSAFSQSLSAFITGDEKAFEVFKELLAKSLADTIAQALTDVFVGTLADALADAFSNKVKEKLGEKVAEAGVDAALGATGAEAIGSAAGGAAEATVEATAIATAIATTLAAELAPVTVKLTAVAGLMQSAGGGLNAAAFALDASAINLSAAAIALQAAATTNVATGGILPGLDAPAVKPFKLGGITRPIENLQVGGIRTRETFARIAEAGTPEAVVPLPGDGRHIPVEFRGGNPAAGGNNTTIIESKVTFVIDDKSGSLRVQLQKHARDIEGIVTRALVDGSNRGMKMAVRRAANAV